VLAEPPLRLATLMPEPIPLITVEIAIGNRQLVTAIEVLSPTNKQGQGRREYLTRRQRLLLSTSHLMEIDLLHAGQRPPMRAALPAAPYFLFLSRAESRPIVDVWPIQLSDAAADSRPVPLLPGDSDVALDLQTAFTQVYDAFSYDLAVDYARPPKVTLDASEAAYSSKNLSVTRRN